MISSLPPSPWFCKRSNRSKRKSFRSVSRIGTVFPSSLNWMLWLAISMTAPSDLKTLLAIRKGVFVGTMTTLIHLEPTGKKTERRPTTVLSLPKRKLTEHEASCIDLLTCLGSSLHRSRNCCSPITDMLAPKSTMPCVPCDAKWTVSSDSFGKRLLPDAVCFDLRGFGTAVFSEVRPSFIFLRTACRRWVSTLFHEL